MIPTRSLAVCNEKRLASFWAILLVLIGAGTPARSFGQAKLGEPVLDTGGLDLAVRPPLNEVPARLESEDPAPAVKTGGLNLPTKPPTNEVLFRLESEDQLRERMHKEYLAAGQKKVQFPPEASVPFTAKTSSFPQSNAFLEPANLCCHPLYFEDVKTERYGIYIPLVQPILSTTCFYLDTLILPVKMTVAPPWSWRCLDNSVCPCLGGQAP
jgi:hypothetical protein